MPSLTKPAALAAGFAAVLTVLSVSPRLAAQGAGASAADPETLVVDEATVDWIEKSSVAALREGVIEKMELREGMPVVQGGEIGRMKSEMASLAVKKAEIAYKSLSPKAKAVAQKELAVAVVARNKRLNERIPGSVSNEEMQKAIAELKVAEALNVEAEEKQQLDKAELDLASRALEEHIIRSPFDGVVIERMKHPGERVGQNEAVVQIGNLNRLRAWVYVPIDYAYRVKEGQVVDFQIKLTGSRANPLPIERKRFRGKIVFVDPQLQPVAETARRIYAELDNRDRELSPGSKGSLTIYLGSEGGAPVAAAPAVGSRAPQAGVGR